MKDIWKMEIWEVPSTNRTGAPIQIAGFRITFTDGVIAVENNARSPLVLLISYYDVDGNERAFLRDNITALLIEKKGIEFGLEGVALETFVSNTMNTLIIHAIGGATKEERYATIAALGKMYGQTLLPLEEQTGIL